MKYTIHALTAFAGTLDNFIWVVHNQNNEVFVVDPGQSSQVIEYIDSHALDLKAILITHSDKDHVSGIDDLLDEYDDVQVYASKFTPLKEAEKVEEREVLEPISGFKLEVLHTPGHLVHYATSRKHQQDHITYFNDELIFTGDILFTAGCGKLSMYKDAVYDFSNSLQKLFLLPDSLKVYCGHEYTLENLAFAKFFEPDNSKLLSRIKNAKQDDIDGNMLVPSYLGLEKETNPFLRFLKMSNEELFKALNKKIGDFRLDISKENLATLEIYQKFGIVRALKDAWDKVN